jgi:hypothetical protein
VDEVAEIVFLVGLVSLFVYPTARKRRRQARVRKAPSGSRETVAVKVMEADETILRWGKLGYNLETRNDFASRTARGLPTMRTRLTFIKR